MDDNYAILYVYIDQGCFFLTGLSPDVCSNALYLSLMVVF